MEIDFVMWYAGSWLGGSDEPRQGCPLCFEVGPLKPIYNRLTFLTGIPWRLVYQLLEVSNGFWNDTKWRFLDEHMDANSSKHHH